MQSLRKNQIIDVQAYKHDGTLYRQWNGVKVIEISPESIVLLMYKTKVSEIYSQKWTVREPIIWFMPRERFFNTTALLRKSGTYFYTNLSSPPLIEDNTIKYIDYDLDVKAYPNQKVRIVDENEFLRNSKNFQYNPQLISLLRRTTEDVLKLIKLKEEFFDPEVIDTYVKELVETKDLSKKFIRSR